MSLTNQDKAKLFSEQVSFVDSDSTMENNSSLESPRISSSFEFSASDECTVELGTNKNTSISRSTGLYYFLLAILVSLIALAGLRLHSQSTSGLSAITGIHQSSVNLTEEAPCGSDANAARNAGCIFDPLTFAWLPPACYDWNLTSEFIAIQDWQYFRLQTDGKRRQLSLINIMQSSDEIIFVSWEFHRQHCAYLWLKMHRAMLERRPIDGVSMLDIITDVCDGVARSDRLGNDTSVPGYVRYPSCRLY